jgi:adenylate kinase
LKNSRYINVRAKTNIYMPNKDPSMKRVILITGTPCTGKTTTSKQLVQKLNADYINLTDFAKTYKLTLGEDLERQTIIIDEEAMQQQLQETIVASNNANVIVDGHYAAAVTPSDLVSKVFVLRRNPKELKAFMQKSGFSEAKMWENLSAEILDSCLIEAMQTRQGKVCELDVTGKTVDENVTEILEVLDKDKKCSAGVVDWLGLLESEGILDEYLKA